MTKRRCRYNWNTEQWLLIEQYEYGWNPHWALTQRKKRIMEVYKYEWDKWHKEEDPRWLLAVKDRAAERYNIARELNKAFKPMRQALGWE